MNELFGTAEKYTIAQGELVAEILTYGATVRSLRFKGQEMVLGYPDPDGYRTGKDYRGSTVGRYANRIANGSFTLGGKEYQLTCNEGENQLHGGFCGLDKKIWKLKEVSDFEITLRNELLDGEEGYPGNLWIEVTFKIENNGLSIIYRAQSDKDTLFNPTNHSYFNLGEPKAENHLLRILADEYTPINEKKIPLGHLAPVEGTPYDFRSLRPIGLGKDHNFALRGEGFRMAAVAESPLSGVRMECYTDRPGVQLYIGNGGFCLETQTYPDAPNQPQFPSAELKADALFFSRTEYRFI